MSADNTYPLIHPIKTDDGKTISHVTMRRPKLKDVRAMSRAAAAFTDPDQKELEGTIAILRGITSLSDAEIDEMDPDDLAALGEKIGAFLSPEGSDQKASPPGNRSRRR